MFIKVVKKGINRERKNTINRLMTCKKLAKLLNISKQQISRYKCDICNITAGTLVIILEILDASIDEFIKNLNSNTFDNKTLKAKNFFKSFILINN